MVKPNAAKHLLFAVSILLFLFVFMGYRMRSSRPDGAGEVPSENGSLASGLRPAVPVADQSSAGTSLRPDTSAVRPLEDPEEVDDLDGWVASGTDDARMPLSLPVPMESSSLRPVGGSSGNDAGGIAGLVPDSARPGGLSLPLPDMDEDGEEDEEDLDGDTDEVVDMASLAASLTRSGGGLKPPGGDSGQPAFLPTPPSGASSSPTRTGEEDDAPFLPLPGTPGLGTTPPAETGTRPSGVRDGGNEPDRGASGTTVSPPSLPLPDRPFDDRSPPASGTVPAAGEVEWEAGADLRVYVIRSGDTLSNIAARELGSASLADNIFLFNRDVIADPDHLMVGQKIRLPARDGGAGSGGYGVSTGPDAAGQGRRPTQGLGRVHRVARGDTLSSISLQYYGTAQGWRFLYEANKSVLPDPNRLSLGTELTIPPYEE